jgi:DNA-binding MarR family transcriptional regulator/GNAT superfamily N-acetyltransferase
MRSLRPASQCEAHGNCPIRPPVGAAPPSATDNTNLSSLDPAIGQSTFGLTRQKLTWSTNFPILDFRRVLMSDDLVDATAGSVAAVRRFSRFYTSQLGLLDEGLLNSAFSLTEARVLYELASRRSLSATDLSRDLGIDPGYLSRVLKKFERRGLMTRSASPRDGRRALLQLTAAGCAAFAPLDQASRGQVRAMIGQLTPPQTARLVRAMETVAQLMGGPSMGKPDQGQQAMGEPSAGEPEQSQRLMNEPLIGEPGHGVVTLRQHGLGDIGWIAHRQAVLYGQEYGWDATYEVLAAEILAGFVRNFDPAWERSWIAERDGTVIGSVFLVRGSQTIAKLRLLYVEPAARGLGLGRRLVDACIAFARQKGYRTLTLWTNDVLVPARRIYQSAGFCCVAKEAHHSFGADLIGETWDLAL